MSEAVLAEPRTASFVDARNWMVEHQLVMRGITDERVLEAMHAVPRERFVPEQLLEFAYEDTPLPIAAGQTISQPYIVALMAEIAAIGPDDVVLEVGAGSGYAAAVMARLGGRVYAIERHAELVETARASLAAIGCRSVEVIHGDGTRGLPEHAPFDAIIVSAGGRRIPDALIEQLAIGGRLVIPVGPRRSQVLKKITRTSLGDVQEENHGLVAFVPLIGSSRRTRKPELVDGSDFSAPLSADEAAIALSSRTPSGLAGRIAEHAEGFGEMHQLAAMIDRFADRRVVLLGEATHGTAEFYEARSWITERLVALHGFGIVAVEADWPDAAAYDAYIRGHAPPALETPPFSRFPRWMWRNAQIYDLLDRLQAANKTRTEKAGFYGLDVYSLGTSIDAVLAYLDRTDPEAACVARERYGCLMPWRTEPARYGRLALTSGYTACEDEVVAVLTDLLRKRLEYLGRDGDAFFDAERNARVAVSAERYYRAMYYGSATSWNLRDEHMFETLTALLDHRGAGSKAVVWAHNSHIGDASETEMGRIRGERNIGELARKAFGDRAALIGFGTDHGTVAAASEWGGPMEVKRLRKARDDSWEGKCREADRPAFLLDLARDDRVRTDLSRTMLERAIGVIYRPDSELTSHYFAADLARQFDAFIWFTQTRAVDAARHAGQADQAETYPFGL